MRTGSVEAMLTFVLWVSVGVLAGLLAKAAIPGTNDEAKSPVVTTVLGILGAVVAGLIYRIVSGVGMSPSVFNVSSLGWAALGAIAVVLIAGMLGSRKVY